MDTALREHEDLVKQYFGTIIPTYDSKFAALQHGGLVERLIRLRPGRREGRHHPLQAYFRINAENMGQFERTLILVEEEAQVHYVEGCTAPDLHEREPALGRGRGSGQEGRSVPLYDDPGTGPTTSTTW